MLAAEVWASCSGIHSDGMDFSVDIQRANDCSVTDESSSRH